VQRFLVNLDRPSFNRVLTQVRRSAENTGRVYAVCYDLSGTRPDQIEKRLTEDWKRLIDKERILEDPQYLHHKGKPVVFVWGFFSDRFDAALANRLIDFFHQNNRYRATLIGGCQWHWRSEKNGDWAKVFRRLDVISPWNVGNYTVRNSRKWANTDSWQADITEAQKHSAEFLPVVYPGFSWRNLKGPSAARDTIPRLGGEFYWRQFVEAAKLKTQMVYVAMFDEVDEATAIFKVTNHPPTQADFVTFEGLPSDWYLRLTGAGTELIRGERTPNLPLPFSP
ncbi:MAG: hypothetical protein KDA84_05225, partial [Planctomycetaceae bacterium]|nr:hypothetical protein [Planctomycetaceae bacterium]